MVASGEAFCQIFTGAPAKLCAVTMSTVVVFSFAGYIQDDFVWIRGRPIDKENGVL